MCSVSPDSSTTRSSSISPQEPICVLLVRAFANLLVSVVSSLACFVHASILGIEVLIVLCQGLHQFLKLLMALFQLTLGSRHGLGEVLVCQLQELRRVVGGDSACRRLEGLTQLLLGRFQQLLAGLRLRKLPLQAPRWSRGGRRPARRCGPLARASSATHAIATPIAMPTMTPIMTSTDSSLFRPPPAVGCCRKCEFHYGDCATLRAFEERMQMGVFHYTITVSPVTGPDSRRTEAIVDSGPATP